MSAKHFNDVLTEEDAPTRQENLPDQASMSTELEEPETETSDSENIERVVSSFPKTVDILSKYAWTVALRGRARKEMVKALQQIFAKGRKPTKLRSDPGTEFVNKDVRALLKKEGVDYFVTRNLVMASYAERSIKSVKGRLVRYMTRHQRHRWINVLADMTENYNKSYHRSIKRSPQSVKPEDSAALWQLQYEVLAKLNRKCIPRKPSLNKIGDLCECRNAKAFQRNLERVRDCLSSIKDI
ncbi:uncharacterized protein LOC128547742 [Mercenaria mercenaria]|uniref:uncharacterized protein LOC128547742 n=1 Tax=Mercenaria mercenaria TaxID=6596 RepID=UPI00234EC75B|nr:uncharacterized protein LOC128547742 [Mercenaria mercenaria]